MPPNTPRLSYIHESDIQARHEADVAARNDRAQILYSFTFGLILLLAIIVLLRQLPRLIHTFNFVYHRTAVINEQLRADTQEQNRRHLKDRAARAATVKELKVAGKVDSL